MLDATELSSLVGYTAIAWGLANGDVDGDEGELVKLDNGMIFELSGWNPMAEFVPEVIVFEQIITPAQAKQIGVERELSGPVAMYKLIIGEELVDAFRLR
jgi:hypothetical protein